VYETGNGIILRTLGYTAAIGVALGIVRKASIVFWTIIGLCIIAWRALPNAWNRVLERSPRLQKLMDSLVLSNLAHRPARTAVSIAGIADRKSTRLNSSHVSISYPVHCLKRNQRL